VLSDRLHLAEGGYPVRYRMLPVEKKDPFFDRDYNLCILCERCVRACEENHVSSAITLTSRGTDTVVGTPFGRTLMEAGCSFCGACVEVCPTGSLSERTRKWSGVPEKEISTTCPLCSAGCQMRLLVKDGMVIGALPDRVNGTDLLCVKGRFGITEMVNHPTRLQQPVSIDPEGNIPVTWEKAIEIAAEKIAACDREKYGLVLSADCSTETMYIARKFAREVVGSKSIHLSSAAVYGRGWQTVQRLHYSSKSLSTLATASTILSLGFDGKYAQSIVGAKIHQAKRGGAKLITLYSRDHSLSKIADEWLQPVPDEEAEMLEMLFEAVANPKTGSPLSQVARSASLLRQSKQPVILVGSSLLTHPDNVVLLKLLERLVAHLHADLILLPEQVNLGGALQMGITNPISTKGLQALEVLHLIGEAIPDGLSSGPFVLYQNIGSPGPLSSGLVLPAAAFTEEEGTFIDHAGTTHRVHHVVQAPGDALPSWQILCRIAKKLGIPGFDFENEAQIRAEIESINHTGSQLDALNLSLLQSDFVVFPSSQIDDHAYMGFPLRTWVAGFQALYPEPTLKREG
jgi:predicted molibdopterin-dependent oxidoreductase YjgC